MLLVGGLLAQRASALITVETVPVGNAGNTADTFPRLGAVGYDYSIGKYEVTLNQYTAFLNAVAKTAKQQIFCKLIFHLRRRGGISSSC